MRPCIPFVVALIGSVTACGETTSRSDAAGAQSSGGSGGASGGSRVGLEGGSSGNTEGGAGSGATYAGTVLAMVTEHEAALTYVARAVFTTGPRPTSGGCPQCCCASTDRGLPAPKKPPDAGDITTLPAAGSTALVTLVPEPFEDGHGVFYGMTDLGWSWFAPLSDYAPVPSQPWNARDTLKVLAKGNEVGPFSGILRAGPALVGVTPPIGSSPVVVDHTQPFVISWTPEADGDATVLLGIPNASGICYCDAPDSAGTLVVDANLLDPIAGEISLARLTVSNVAASNASIDQASPASSTSSRVADAGLSNAESLNCSPRHLSSTPSPRCRRALRLERRAAGSGVAPPSFRSRARAASGITALGVALQARSSKMTKAPLNWAFLSLRGGCATLAWRLRRARRKSRCGWPGFC